MSLLSPELQQNINCAFNLPNIITDLDLAKTDRAHISDPIGKAGNSLNQCKSRIFDIKLSSTMMSANEITESQPMSTSMDFLFGGPLHRGEVTSIEGGAGTGKTRLCVKLAHEISCSGRVLYIDADMSLQHNIIRKILQSLNLPISNSSTSSMTSSYNEDFIIHPFTDNSLPHQSIPSSFHLAICSNSSQLFHIINSYITIVCPDLILIDSALSLFQDSMGTNGPASAFLQELALEFKKIVYKCNCVGIITNSLKPMNNPGGVVPRDPSVPQNKEGYRSFYGQIYSSLWHQRLIMNTKAFYSCTCELVSSPRYPYQKVIMLLETLTEASEQDILPEQS